MASRSSFNQEFIQKAIQFVVFQIGQSDFSGNELASLLNLSREQTHRNFKKYLSVSTGKFIRYIRLLKAYDYLRHDELTISEIGYKVGFINPAYFNKCFKDEFGKTPGEVKELEHGFCPAESALYRFYMQEPIKKELSNYDFNINWTIEPIQRHRSFPVFIPIFILSIFVILFILNFSKKEVAFAKSNSIIAVIPFTNETGDTSLNQIGEIASSWISSRLEELQGFKTVPYFTIQEYLPYLGILPDDIQRRPTFGEIVKADSFLTGKYFSIDGEIYFDVDLVDAHTQEVIFEFPVFKGPLESVTSTIEQIRLDVYGLLSNLNDVKDGKLNPPNYEAYTNYLNGLREMKVGLYPSEAATYLSKAAELEPNFVLPQIFLTWFIERPKRDSMMQLIGKIPNKTAYEKALYTNQQKMFQRKYHEALQISLKMINDYPQDYYFNMMAGHEYKSLFMPEQSVKILSQLEDPIRSDLGLMWHYFKTRNVAESYIMLDKNEEALKYLNSIPQEFQNRAIPVMVINIFLKLGKSQEEIESYLSAFSNTKDYPSFLLAAAWEYSLMFEDSIAMDFAKKAIHLIRKSMDENLGDFDLVDAYFLAGDLASAKRLLLAHLVQNPENEDLNAYLAYVIAKQGNPKDREDLLNHFEEKQEIDFRRHPYKYQINYHLARIYALYGEKEMAISHLQKALENGQLKHYWDFEHDIFLRSLRDYPPFLELVKPV